MVLGFGRWAVKEVAKKLTKSKTGGVGSITGVRPGAKFKGQKTKESIIKAGKEKKKKIVDEDFRENARRYFTNQPPKNPKKKVDKDIF